MLILPCREARTIPEFVTIGTDGVPRSSGGDAIEGEFRFGSVESLCRAAVWAPSRANMVISRLRGSGGETFTFERVDCASVGALRYRRVDLRTLSVGDLSPSCPPNIPGTWIEVATEDRGSTRYYDPNQLENSVLVFRGSPAGSSGDPLEPFVIVTDGGVVVGRGGARVLVRPAASDATARIPLGEWMGWRSWNAP
jgi:hypothetical protein